MCSSCGYKSLPYVLGFISMTEMILGILRIIIFFEAKPSHPNDLFSFKSYNESQLVASPLLSSTQAKAAFAIDWIASIVPTFMGIYVALFILLACCSILITCDCVNDTVKNRNADVAGCSTCCTMMCIMCASKSNHRCVSLTWNCPCYKARPKLRFQVRFGLLAFFIFLRVIAIILYASDKNVNVYGGYMAALCSISVGLVCLVISIDYYQYRVWWYYRPEGAYKKCRCCCCKQQFHPSHQRFLPAPLLGVNREIDRFGNRPCQHTVSGHCPNLSLEHIVIFHAFDFKPLRRYRHGVDTTYIGFHRTRPELAVNIAKIGFQVSSTPPQMLGFGVYFARSFADTEDKARATGAFICAEVNMGRVRVIDKSELNEVCNTNSWWNTYDTIYYAHDEENRDEFCVKDPAQILKWVIIMDDNRMHRYGLDHEFDNTRCGCT